MGVTYESASKSHVGMVRQVNEDAFLDLPENRLWVVADGMGGHAAGDYVSSLIVDSLRHVPLGRSLDEYSAALRNDLLRINAAVREETANRGVTMMGSTVVVFAARGLRGVCLWAGDSRLYRLRDGVLESIPFYTRPDGTNVINNTITQGLLNALANPGPPGSFNFTGTITDNADGDELSVTFDFLDSLSETELLSAPKITTLSRRRAVIRDYTSRTFITDAERITEYIEGGGLYSTGRTFTSTDIYPETYEFGITLTVTPQVCGTDLVRLWLNPYVDTYVGEDTYTTTSYEDGQETQLTTNYPQISTQEIYTNVLVHDGDTLVLGGMISDRTQKGDERLPYLADIPLLGFFFRGKSRQVSQNSLLIFVTVDIMDPTGARYFEPAS